MRQGLAAIAGVIALGCLSGALAGCATAPKLASVTFPTADETARAILAEVASGADVARDPRVGPQFADNKAAEHLRALRRLIPKALPIRVAAAGWRMTGRSDDGATADLTYSWAYPHQTLLMRAVLHREHDEQRWTVTGVQARRAGRNHALAAVGQIS
ncbi:MAG TPA: hypothetical protein VG407_02155 [Caulobacteraceae bacterium]|jgi:hypothetical protein|nr:hypothetical protein [Caulobacteraceae bacterium]